MNMQIIFPYYTRLSSYNVRQNGIKECIDQRCCHTLWLRIIKSSQQETHQRKFTSLRATTLDPPMFILETDVGSKPY